MLVTETKIRVRYGETDQMGFVYYGNYPEYYEVGRTEALRQLGTSYKQLEDEGILMPVIKMNVRYIKPGRYDDLLTIKTIVKEVPRTRMEFVYEIYNESGELINVGETTLIFLSKERNKPVACPEWLAEIFAKNDNKE
jgi:acyl-CoA thioester hydrolase